MPDSLYPIPQTYAIPTPVTRQRPTAPVTFPMSYLFDPVTGDFATDGAGRVIRATGRETAKQWTWKVSTTQRGAHRIYARRFGPDLEGAVRAEGGRRNVEARIAAELDHALTRDPRVRSVMDFTYVWGTGGLLSVGYAADLADGSRIRGEARVSDGS